ncbi:unnamed protein product [Paramecium sonneborni]|uniref:Uncharacterized protein n=1 Tax=Paramecium sonneborni TaxID=65129 RepID=A0A8S1JYB6_9CILI|nr:unnamed protein product [Paramecium sonneborni]
MIILSLLALFSLLNIINATCELVNGQCPVGCNTIFGVCVSENCFDFTEKLGDKQTNPFKGTTSYVDGTVDLNITITYTDSKFNDVILKGITKGENEQSCLSLKLYKFQNNQYLIREESSYKLNYINDGSSTRSFQFTIPSKDFVKELQLSEDGNKFQFHGYYSFDFLIGTNLQRVLYFDFIAGIEKTTTQNIDTNFGSLSQYLTLNCSGECITTATSSLQFCSDQECTKTTDKANLYLNDQIWLKHTLTKQGTEGFYLTNPEIYFTGDKLFKKATIKEKKLNQKGFALYLIKVEIAWTPVSISAKAILSSTPGARILRESSRLLDETQSQAVGVTSDIECVKNKDTNECIECDQTKPVNNQDDPQENGCPIDSHSGMIIGIMILMSLLI